MADLPGEPLPPLNPQTKEPAGPPDLLPIFPEALIEQEVSAEPEIEIPEEVREAYKLWRPTPLLPRAPPRAGARHAGAHLLQVRGRLARRARTSRTPRSRRPTRTRRPGIRKLATETGAGQWGSSLAFACRLFGLECEVFMVGSRYDQKPYRRSMMETWGATVHRSPVAAHRGRARATPSTPPGSLGIAISEAVEVAAQNEDTNYALGSVLNHVLLHQTVIGQEAIAQMEMAGEEPGRRDRLRRRRLELRRARRSRSCARNLREGATTRFIGAEPAACPTLTQGRLRATTSATRSG